MLTQKPATLGAVQRAQNTNLNASVKVKASWEHVFDPRPETHRWSSHQQISSCLPPWALQNVYQRSEYDAGQVAKAPSPTVKNKHSDKQENVITPPTPCATHCCREASESSLQQSQSRAEARDSAHYKRQIQWARRRFNPINLHWERRLITFGSPQTSFTLLDFKPYWCQDMHAPSCRFLSTNTGINVVWSNLIKPWNSVLKHHKVIICLEMTENKKNNNDNATMTGKSELSTYLSWGWGKQTLMTCSEGGTEMCM